MGGGRRQVAGFVSFLFETLLPGACVHCGAELSRDSGLPAVLPRGWPGETVDFFRGERRMKIFGGLTVPSRILCEGCWFSLDPVSGQRSQPVLTAGIPLNAPFFINETLLDVVKYLKFGGGRTAAEPLSWWMARALPGSRSASWTAARSGPLLMPVPLHPARRRERGYNQAGLLAGGVASRLGLKMETRAFARIRNTKRQSDLEPAERDGNVHGAFKLASPRLIEGADIVLVDDLVTTGATVRACLEALAGGRPTRVSVLAAGISASLLKAAPKPETQKIGSS